MKLYSEMTAAELWARLEEYEAEAKKLSRTKGNAGRNQYSDRIRGVREALLAVGEDIPIWR